MRIQSSSIGGVQVVDLDLFQDERGAFIKLFHADIFEKNGINLGVAESFYTCSKKNVIRGMHFQSPPHDHSKLVTVVSGKVLDVVVDIRRNSPTYGRCVSFELSRDFPQAVFIPRGLAHGFLTLSNEACMLYMTDSVHAPQCDCGIRWDSFGFDWPVETPTLSDRDNNFEPLELFNTPFN